MEAHVEKKMMNKKALFLDWLFFFASGSYLFMALASIGYDLLQLWNHSVIPNVSSAPFPFFYSLARYFDLLANGFFAFLIALVLRVLNEQISTESRLVSRCVNLCAVFYLLSGLAGIAHEFDAIYFILQTGSWINLFTFFGLFQPVLYAVAIFIVYRKFSELARFREEVA